MDILGNSILGMNFSWSSLRLTEEGLYRKIRDEKTNAIPLLIFLTSDKAKITALIGLKPEIFDNINEDVYPHLIATPYFRTNIFRELKSNKNGRLLDDFGGWLDTNIPYEEEEYKPIRTVEIENLLGVELKDKIATAKRVVNEYPKHSRSKFNACKKLLIADGYIPQNFSEDIPKFKDSFKDKLDFWKFTVDCTPEEMKERYLESCE